MQLPYVVAQGMAVTPPSFPPPTQLHITTMCFLCVDGWMDGRHHAQSKVHVTEHIYIYVALIYAPREACAAVGAVNEMIFAFSTPSVCSKASLETCPNSSPVWGLTSRQVTLQMTYSESS